MPRKHRHAQKGTGALRRGRFSGIKQIYHVTTCTSSLEPVFRDFLLGRLVVLAMKREDDAGYTNTLAFVLMPDHLHWLFQLVADRKLSTSVNTVKSFATRSINRVRCSSGRLWQRGFHDRAIRKEEDLQAVARYIVANPLRAGIVASVRDYALWDARWV